MKNQSYCTLVLRLFFGKTLRRVLLWVFSRRLAKNVDNSTLRLMKIV